VRRRAAALLSLACALPLAGCGGESYVPERVAVTLYASGPPDAQRPAIAAVQRVIARRGGTSGKYRVTLSWQGVPDDAPIEARLAAARRAVDDARAVAFVDAGDGDASVPVVQLLNSASVPAANVADPGLARELCGRDAFPSGTRTAVAPQGATAAERAAAVTEAVFDALGPMPVEFTREPVTRALVSRFGACS
jgi:hypothetical protein